MQPGRIAFIAAVLCGCLRRPGAGGDHRGRDGKLVFTPAEVTAKVGDTIEWDNKDVLAHTATATDKSLDVMLPPKKTGSLTVKKAGTFDYFCKFHPNMKAKMTVAP